jgi:hypothetical protein
MFAGPNGSGKSTLKKFLPSALLGIYLNPDEMEQAIRADGFLDFSVYGVSPTESSIRKFFETSTLLARSRLQGEIPKLRFSNGRVDFNGVAVNSYFCSVTVDLLRHELLQRKIYVRDGDVTSREG